MWYTRWVATPLGLVTEGTSRLLEGKHFLFYLAWITFERKIRNEKQEIEGICLLSRSAEKRERDRERQRQRQTERQRERERDRERECVCVCVFVCVCVCVCVCVLDTSSCDYATCLVLLHTTIFDHVPQVFDPTDNSVYTLPLFRIFKQVASLLLYSRFTLMLSVAGAPRSCTTQIIPFERQIHHTHNIKVLCCEP